jgi:hypothetical protein
MAADLPCWKASSNCTSAAVPFAALRTFGDALRLSGLWVWLPKI